MDEARTGLSPLPLASTSNGCAISFKNFETNFGYVRIFSLALLH